MKERKFYQIGKWLGRGLSIVGGAMMVLLTIAVCESVSASQHNTEKAEIFGGRMMPGLSELHPLYGVDYELEVRVLADDYSGAWYHNAKSVNYGDTVEVRLKAVAAKSESMNYARLSEIVSQSVFAPSAGLKAVETATRHNFVLPDGTTADYFEEYFDEHVSYVYVGTYVVGCRDQWLGRGSSVVSANIMNQTGTRLVLTPPLSGFNLRALFILGVMAVVCYFLGSGTQAYFSHV